MDATAVTVFCALFGFVTLLGFFASRWRRGDLSALHEWGLGGRRFGTIVTWFLLGGDLYTAYTFIAVPALMFGAGAVGFFAVPYTVLVYPLLFAVFPRLWSVAQAKGYVTAADFVRGRFASPSLALAVAVTGIVATMPYIALQLVGMEVVIAGLGIPLALAIPGVGTIPDAPLLLAFAVLAAFTYTSGLRAPAMIAVVKDALLYVTVLAAIVVIPAKLGGYGKIFASVDAAKLILPANPLANPGQFSYATLALGSTLALFLYPHAMTGLLSASSRRAVRRNAVILPAYSFALGLIALLGFMAVAAGVKAMPAHAAGFKNFANNFAVPALFLEMFPSWFVGVAFAAIAIGALVPAAIMSIACANLFTRNIYREFLSPNCTPRRESSVAKLTSLVVKLGALFFIIGLPMQYAIQLQLLGGIWIIQTLPSVLLGLYTRKLHPLALLIGWAAGIGAGTWMAAQSSFKSSIYALHILGASVPCYAALSSLVLNITVAVVLSLILNPFARAPTDATLAEDYV